MPKATETLSNALPKKEELEQLFEFLQIAYTYKKSATMQNLDISQKSLTIHQLYKHISLHTHPDQNANDQVALGNFTKSSDYKNLFKVCSKAACLWSVI